MFHNIVIGTPLVEPWTLISETEDEFNKFDKRDTLFTNERFLPAILVEAGIVKSRNEVRRNRPDLFISLDKIECKDIKIGKNKIFIIVGK